MIIAHEGNDLKRRIRAAIFIDKVKDKNMNQDKGVEVSPLWLNLLSTR